VSYHCPGHGSCRGIWQRIGLSLRWTFCTRRNNERNALYFIPLTRLHGVVTQNTTALISFVTSFISHFSAIFTVTFCLLNISCSSFHANSQLQFSTSVSFVVTSTLSHSHLSSNFKISLDWFFYSPVHVSFYSPVHVSFYSPVHVSFAISIFIGFSQNPVFSFTRWKLRLLE